MTQSAGRAFLPSDDQSDRAIWAIVPAAGSGSRMRAAIPKQYLSLLGQPVIRHSSQRLSAHTRVRGVMVGLAADDTHWPEVAVDLPKLLGTFTGGPTRAHTVLNGLLALAAHARADDWVMVHDAVRPCVRLADIDRLITVATAGAEGGLLALPVSDTVKRVDNANRVTQTVSRDNLWRAQTPQLFRFDRLEAALRRAIERGLEVTDEASAIEAEGGHPIVVSGHPDNIKITMPEDLPLAELFLRQQEGA